MKGNEEGDRQNKSKLEHAGGGGLIFPYKDCSLFSGKDAKLT